MNLLSYTDLELHDITLLLALHLGIFPLWFRTMWLAAQMVPGVKWWHRGLSFEELHPILADCPVWMKYMTYGVAIYSVPDMLLSIGALIGKVPAFFLPIAQLLSARSVDAHPALGLNLISRAFSGVAMAFYCIALSTAVAADQRQL